MKRVDLLFIFVAFELDVYGDLFAITNDCELDGVAGFVLTDEVG